jgi:hypothetical protein
MNNTTACALVTVTLAGALIVRRLLRDSTEAAAIWRVAFAEGQRVERERR